MRAGEYNSRWPMTGRDNEISQMMSQLGNKLAEGIIVYGDEGVGKTRLVKEFANRARRQGYRCDRITASSLAAAVPLGALAHLLPPAFDPADPLAVFQAAVASVKEQHRRRLVLVADDMHHLDPASVVLLTQLMDAGLIFLVGALRPDHATPQVGDMLNGREGLARLHLTPLRYEMAAEVITQALGGVVDGRTVYELVTASDGNLLYLHEMTDQAVSQRTLVREGGIWHLRAPLTTSRRLNEVVIRRLDSIATADHRILHVLALTGPAGVHDLADLAPADTLTRLEKMGLIETQTNGQRVTADLTHPVYREVITAQLTHLQARDIIDLRLKQLEAHGTRRSEDALKVVSLKLVAGQPVEPALIVQAARFARLGHDYDRVISLLSSLPNTHRTLVSQLLLGEAFYQSGRFDDADAVFLDALSFASNDVERTAITIERTQNLVWGVAHPEKAIEINTALAQSVPDPALNASLMINEGAMHIIAGRPIKGIQLITQNAAQEVDERVALYGTGIKVIGLAATGATEGAVHLGERNSTHHKRVSKKIVIQHYSAALSALSLAYMANGNLPKAQAAALRGYNAAVAEKAVQPSAWLAYAQGRSAWLAGRPKTAQYWYSRALFMARMHNLLLMTNLAAAGVAASSALLDGASDKDVWSGTSQGCSHARLLAGEEALGQAWSAATDGSLAAARDILGQAAQRAHDAEYYTSEMLLLTEIARLGGAEEIASRMMALGELCDGPFSSARVDFTLGLATKDPDLLLATSVRLELIGALLLAAEAAAAAARMLQRKNLITSSVYAAQTVARLSAHCEGASTPGLSLMDTPQPLTERELEIAYIASRGLSSKEIAATLTLSVRTVDNHLHRLYSKLGITNRRQIATALKAMKGSSRQ